MLGDLLPELSAYIDATGGRRSPEWRYLAVLDDYERMMSAKGFEVSNAMRAAVLMTGIARKDGKSGAGPRTMQLMMKSLKVPKAVYFSAALLIESRVRLSVSPTKGKSRFIHNRDFLDALDYNRIVLRAEKRSEETLNEWSDLYEQKGNT